jgi:hypothetical protein
MVPWSDVACSLEPFNLKLTSTRVTHQQSLLLVHHLHHVSSTLQSSPLPIPPLSYLADRSLAHLTACKGNDLWLSCTYSQRVLQYICTLLSDWIKTMSSGVQNMTRSKQSAITVTHGPHDIRGILPACFGRLGDGADMHVGELHGLSRIHYCKGCKCLRCVVSVGIRTVS